MYKIKDKNTINSTHRTHGENDRLQCLKNMISKCSPDKVLSSVNWQIHVVDTVGNKSVRNTTRPNEKVCIVTQNMS